jgi:6-phosphogluconolactonase
MGESRVHDGGEPVKVAILPDPATAAHEAAKVIAASARDTVLARRKFVFAVSGGRTPWQMLRELAREDVPWKYVHLVQVDERIAPAGHHDRNLPHIQNNLLSGVPLPNEQVHAMPVEVPDLKADLAQYASMLQKIAGHPPIFDLVHLGLGPDGHTASMIPQRFGARGGRNGRCADGRLPRPPTHDVNLSDSRSSAMHCVVGDVKRQARRASSPR